MTNNLFIELALVDPEYHLRDYVAFWNFSNCWTFFCSYTQKMLWKMQFFPAWEEREGFQNFFKFQLFLALRLEKWDKKCIFYHFFQFKKKGEKFQDFSISLPLHPKNVLILKNEIFPVRNRMGELENFFNFDFFFWLLHPKDEIKNGIFSCLKGTKRIPTFFQISPYFGSYTRKMI